MYSDQVCNHFFVNMQIRIMNFYQENFGEEYARISHAHHVLLMVVNSLPCAIMAKE